ncbi:MAG: GNAT family N-acetyltransferase [Bifidobacteriaceae bacterium]|jgi:ribosomal-protein-alanine N-acetyltransferase|nr:GNAT family N-acetyltransferase [Bifidobacteriaceae bacterium]
MLDNSLKDRGFTTKRVSNEIFNIEQKVFAKPHNYGVIEQAVSDANKLFYLQINNKSQVIGYAGLIITPDFNDIWSIAVDPKWQHLGFGYKLMNWILTISKNKKVFLEVDINNYKAINLYKDFGFVIIDKRQNYFATGVPAFIMTKTC